MSGLSYFYYQHIRVTDMAKRRREEFHEALKQILKLHGAIAALSNPSE